MISIPRILCVILLKIHLLQGCPYEICIIDYLCMVFNNTCKSSMRLFSGSMLRNVASDKKSTSFTILELVIHVCICIFTCNRVFYICINSTKFMFKRMT